MISLIEKIKSEVSQHTVVPFTANDIRCHEINKQPVITVADKYTAINTTNIMNALGIRSNLSKDIFAKPDENWGAFREAIASIDKKKKFACIVDSSDRLRTLVNSDVTEAVQLNYDDRLDELLNTIDSDDNHTFQNISFNPETVTVDINSISDIEIDTGAGDPWNFGTTTTIGLGNQQFQQYFLRLICTNGMTTRENIAYRMANASKNIGRQFLRFNSKNDMTSAIKPRVDKLRNSRASLYEVSAVAACLKKEDRQTFFSHYDDIVDDFEDNGFNINDLSSKRQRFMYTDENMYDLFNLSTYLATHQRPVIGDNAALNLNKLAGEFFTNGPVLGFNLVDIYNRKA